MAGNPYVKNVYSGVVPNTSPTDADNNGVDENVLVNTNYGLRPNIQQVTNSSPTTNKGNAYQKQYAKDSVMSMTQGELLLRLYDEVIKQINLAIKSIDNQDDATDEELAKMQNDLDLVQQSARDFARQELENKARKKFKDEEVNFTEDDVKSAVTEKAIDDIVNKTGIKNFNNGGKVNNEKNRDLSKTRDEALDKIQKIIEHLRMTLNFDYEISDNLNSLYEYFRKCVVSAKIDNISKPIKEILPLVTDLREAYSEAEKNVRTGSPN